MKSSKDLKRLDSKAIGQRIRNERENRGYTREKMATMLGITPKFLADIEYGEKGMSLTTLYKLVQLLNCSFDYFLLGDHFIDGAEDVERQRVKESILVPLDDCSIEQLKCMEQIARYYAEGLDIK